MTVFDLDQLNPKFLTLEPEQKSLLLNNKGAENPLYLSYVCENLRQFGDYSLVTKRLKTYPQTTDQLLDVLLNEVYVILDNEQLVNAFFKLLIVSNIGILESDIVNMLEYYMSKTTDENNSTSVNQMIWSTIRRQLKTFLDISWIEGHQLIIFRHSSLEQKIRKRCLKEDSNEIRSLHAFLAEFYLKKSAIKDFASRRVPYHYEQAHMFKDLVTFLRSGESRGVGRLDRQTYLRKLRCSTLVPPLNDTPFNQRAYVCHVCAMQFKLGPFTMTKSSCLVCTNMIPGGNMPQTSAFRYEARLCQKHGSQGFPITLQCVVCRTMMQKPTGKGPAFIDPVPLNICFECYFQGGGIPRCCGLELN